MSGHSQIFIDISDAEWKIVQFRKDKGRILLKRCDVIAASGRALHEIEKDLKSVIGVSARRADTIVSLPRKKVLLKYMRLPSSDPKEIAKMVGLQLVSQIPYAMQEIVYDHVILRTDETGYAHIQIVVVLAEVIEEYLKLLKPLGVSVSRMSTGSYGLSAWFGLMAQKRAWPDQKVFLALNIDKECAEACFCQGSRMLFSRFIPSGYNDLNRNETAPFFQQLQWSLDLYHKEHVGPELSHIVIVGEEEVSGALKTMIEEKFKAAVDTAHPFDIVDERDRRTFESMRPGGRCSWTVCLGHMLNPAVQSLNLSPGTLRKDYASKKRSKQQAAALGFLAATAVLCVLFFIMETGVRRTRITMIDQQTAAIQPEADRLKLMAEHTRALDDYFAKRVRISDLMKELYKRTPEDVIYQSVSLTEEGEWILQGYAQTRSGVNNLQSGLIDSSRFQDVRLDYATKRKLGNADVTDFKIHFRLADKTRTGK